MPTLFLTIGVLAVSAAPLLIRLAEPVPPLLIAASRVALAAIVLALLSGKQWIEIVRLRPREQGLIVVAGLALAAHFGLWIASFPLTSTSASVALVATQPVFAGLLGYLFIGEGFRRQELVGVGLALTGSLVLAGGDLGGGSSDAILGDALALGGAAMVPVYLLAGRVLGNKIPILPYLSAVNAVAGIALVGLAMASGLSMEGAAAVLGQEEVLALLGLGLLCSVVGHTSLNYCVRLVPVHLVSLGILVEPVVATLSTWLLLGEVPNAHTLVGGAVIIIGIYVGFGWQPSTDQH